MKPEPFNRIYSLSELSLYLEDPQETLLVFDIDYTLTHPNEPSYQFANFIKNKEVIERIFLDLNPQERDLFSNLMVFHLCGNSPIETQGPRVIQNLQESGYKTLALTASITTPLKEESLIQKRIENLKELGFDFSSFFTELEATSFDKLTPNFNAHPHFEEGILFSNGENQKNHKGEVLNAFLSLLNSMPKNIVMLDDRLQNLETVQKALKEVYPDIHFTGLHFLGALKFPSQEVSKEDFKTKIEELALEAKTLHRKFSDSIET